MMKIYFKKKKQVFAEMGEFTIKTDQAEKSGGDNEFPEPLQMFLASIGTCVGVTVKNFCDQREIDTSQIEIEQKNKFHPEKKIIDEMKIKISVPPDFPEKYENALIKSAESCAVKRHLREDIKVKTSIVRTS